MKVKLLEDIENVGKAGETLEGSPSVKTGSVWKYCLPMHGCKAVAVDEEAMAIVESQINTLNSDEEKSRARSQIDAARTRSVARDETAAKRSSTAAADLKTNVPHGTDPHAKERK